MAKDDSDRLDAPIPCGRQGANNRKMTGRELFSQHTYIPLTTDRMDAPNMQSIENSLVMKKMTFYVFSFNRGLFLKNCVESIMDLAPGYPIVIIDDNSTDPVTLDIIRAFPPEVKLLPPPCRTEGRHGGLYVNMQTALDHCKDDLVAFVQDDLQMVRPLTEDDVDSFCGFFARFPGCAFISPCFLRGYRRRRKTKITHPINESRYYFAHYPEKKNFRGIYFNDVHIASAARLRSVDWQYVTGEVENAALAASHFDKMGIIADPLMMPVLNTPNKKRRRPAFYSAMHLRLNHYYTRSRSELDDKLRHGPASPTVRRDSERKVRRMVATIEADPVEDTSWQQFARRIGFLP